MQNRSASSLTLPSGRRWSPLVLVAAFLLLSSGTFTQLAWGEFPSWPENAQPLFLATDDDAKQTVSIGAKIDDFSLTDFRGREWTLADFHGKRGLVVVFLGTECPLAKLYSARIVELATQFEAQQIAFLAVDANDQDSLAEMNAHARKHEFPFPFVKDVGQKLANQLGMTRTPEVCLLDEHATIRYRGRIDDQYGIGYTKKAPTQDDLRLAVEALVKDQPIAVTSQPAMGCLIGRKRTTQGDESVTYCNQIARILQQRCVDCHRQGDIGPMALTDYEDVASWGSMLLEVIQDRRMPPWHATQHAGYFANDRSMPESEIALVEKWVAAGTPYGDANQLPAPKTYVEGWQLPRQPDLVLEVSPKPFKIPATGDVKYQYFRVDPKLTEDKWIEAAEIQPGNRSVVHHILVFSREKGSQGDLEGHRGFLFGYVPGTRVDPMPAGMAKRLTKNSELIFQVHYTPVGTEQTDQSRLGIVFADPASITYEVQTTSAVQIDLNIPPGDPEYRTSAMLPEELPQCQLLSMSPHMHLRGKSFRYTAILPNGTRKVVLDIPRYDFNWQTEYRLAESEQFPAGTRIFCEAAFDNSEKNLNNPDPKARVRWGDQTYEEMMIGYFHVAVALDPTGKAAKIHTQRPRGAGIDPAAIFSRLDANGDDRLTADEIPKRLKTAVEKLDTNRDGILERSELPK